MGSGGELGLDEGVGLRYLRAGVDSAWEQEKLEARKMFLTLTLPALSLSKGQVHALLGALETQDSLTK